MALVVVGAILVVLCFLLAFTWYGIAAAVLGAGCIAAGWALSNRPRGTPRR